MPGAFDDPQIQALFQRALGRTVKPTEPVVDETDLLSADLLKFSDVKPKKQVDLSVFNRVKLDAGLDIPTQAITSRVEGGRPVDGPYFKTDSTGRKKLDLDGFVVQDPDHQPQVEKKVPAILEKLAVKRVDQRIPSKNDKEDKPETTGPKWFDMKAAELTPEVKQDLMIIKSRAALNPKHFYKKDDSKTLPKFFQMGTIIESKADFYSGRLTKKQRKETFVDALLDDHEQKQYLKSKFIDIQRNKRKPHRRAFAKRGGRR